MPPVLTKNSLICAFALLFLISLSCNAIAQEEPENGDVEESGDVEENGDVEESGDVAGEDEEEEKAPHPVPSDLGPKILGASEASVADLLNMDPTLFEDDWQYFGKDIGVRFEAERAVQLIVRVPGGMSCKEAAAWLGYPDAGFPMRKSSACLWPGQSERHRLAGGVIGEFYLKQAQFSVKLQTASP